MQRTSHRDIFLLACCQALLLVNNAGLISMNGLVGYALVDDKMFATVGATTYLLGSTAATMPASLWMGRVGRRRGFMTGSVIGIIGSAVAALAVWLHSFPVYCLGTAIIGVYTAFGLQYRFAAAEVAEPSFKAKAISLVLAGGIVGGFLGPESTRWTKNLFETEFLGSFVTLSVIAVFALLVQSRVHVPKPSVEELAEGGRKLPTIMRQPVFIVAAMSAALGYGLMNLLMTATPLAMSFCSHPYAAAVMVIEWHVVGMYGPGFFTGSLIKRYGTLKVIGLGIAIMGSCAVVALNGNSIAHFLFALALLGIGWNFMYTGGTTLLTESYRPAEKAKTQGANDFIVFSTMTVTSFSSGALVSAAGWEWMNIGALPVLVIVAAGVGWLAWHRRRHVARTAIG
jgi:MFS family permease